MRFQLLSLFLITAMMTAACGTSHRSRDDDPGECGDERTATTGDPEPIVNGTSTHNADVVALTEGQVLAVGALMQRNGGDWSNSCTATLVAPRLVLTAAHCVLDWSRWPPGTAAASQLRFGVGVDVETPDAVFEVAQVERHEGYRFGMESTAENDVAVLVLTQDATAALPGIQPIPLNCTALPESFVGQDVQNVGYGITETGRDAPPNSRRWWTVEEVTELSRFDFTVYGHGLSAVCNGDSGGPSLWTMPDGVVRVVGTVSWGDPSCVDYDHFARVDDNCDFFERFYEGCGEVTEAGSCDGNNAVYCESGSVTTVDCAAMGRSCGTTAEGLSRCIDSCGGETWQGRCDEHDAAIWCEDGEVMNVPCVVYGGVCGTNAEGLNRCIDPDSCGDETWEGRCEGDDAIWCQDGEVRVRNCADCDQSCGWSDSLHAYYCI